MNKIVLAFAAGYLANYTRMFVQFVHQNPDNPSIMQMREANEKFRGSMLNLKNEIKKSWARSKTTLEFNEVIKNY